MVPFGLLGESAALIRRGEVSGIICARWKRDREAEGAPLLREYAVLSRIEGSNPSVSARRFFRILGA